MGGVVEDSQWFDNFMDGIGLVFTKVDESIQKGIGLWTELTKDLLENQPNQDLTGQTNNGESGEEHSSQDPLVEVKERPIQHWAMHASKIPESTLIQEQGNDDYFYGNEFDVDDDDDYEYDYYYGDEEEKDETTDSEEDSLPSLTERDVYRLLNNADTSSEDSDESWDEDDDDESHYYVEEEVEKYETIVSDSEIMWELNLGALATRNIPSSNNHQNEEDSGSSLKRKGGYQLLKNVDTSSEEDDEESSEDDEVKECHSEDVEEVVKMFQEPRVIDLSNESLVVHEDQDDVSEKLQGFVNVSQEEITNNTELGEVVTLFPESDWVYVTRD